MNVVARDAGNAATRPEARTNNFDVVRLVAAFFVVFGHSYSLSSDTGAPSVLSMGIHTVGVKIFFCLSGYLMMSTCHLGFIFGLFQLPNAAMHSVLATATDM
ncbi:MAG: acyltransferase family protein [Hyphomonadaceae bacterium]|nr:acyltransferase family protein [Hyphomonadaceae bacterium]